MRVVAISDQHGHKPVIPTCDLLLVAGDQCLDNFNNGRTARTSPDLQWQWFIQKWLPWRYEEPAKGCLVTWGNHDYCGEEHRHFRNSAARGTLWTEVACDKLVEVMGLKVYLTPWSNQFMTWAFMREPLELARYYEQIPEGIDILVTHQPPHGCGDGYRYYDLAAHAGEEQHLGSVELRDAILRVRPKVVVCGHIHAGHGRYELDGIPVYNVSVVNEAYQLVHPPTMVWDV